MTEADVTHVLGIDIGGSGIKAAPVDVVTGQKVRDRHRIATPHPATPEAIEATVAELVRYFKWSGPIGCTFPGVVRDGEILTAVNLHPDWIGVKADQLFGAATGCAVTMVNDGDAAGVAEMRFGAGAGLNGVIMMVTLGTGIGTAMFVDGRLVPNTELGHIEVGGIDGEIRASARVKDEQRLSWEAWAGEVDLYLRTLENLVWPELFIIGGGVSKSFDQFAPFLTCRTPLASAQQRNDAGIIGAAIASAEYGPQ